MNRDPWKYRNKTMKCRTCMYFVRKEVEGANSCVGRCRRLSPTMSGFPVVFEDDWCGSHKIGILVLLGYLTSDQASALTQATGSIAGGIITAAGAFGYAHSRGQAKKGKEE